MDEKIERFELLMTTREKKWLRRIAKYDKTSMAQAARVSIRSRYVMMFGKKK